MCCQTPFWGLLIAAVIYGVGGGLIEVLVSPIVDSLPGEAKDSAMALLHSFYCWGQVSVVAISTLLIWVIGENWWFILPVVWSLLPLSNLWRCVKMPLMPPIPEERKMSLKELIRNRQFILILVLMLCAGASELTMSQWSSLFCGRRAWGSQGAGRPCWGPVPLRHPDGCRTHHLRRVWRPHQYQTRDFGNLCTVRPLLPDGLALHHSAALALCLCTHRAWDFADVAGRLCSGGKSAAPRRHGALRHYTYIYFWDVYPGPGLRATSPISFKKRMHFKIFPSSPVLSDSQIGLKCGLLLGLIFPLVMLLGVRKLRTSTEEVSNI